MRGDYPRISGEHEPAGSDRRTDRQGFCVSGSRVEQIITLKSGVLEYQWIIRAYLLSKAAAQGVELTPFTALRGNPHDYWFLDGDFIDRGEID